MIRRRKWAYLATLVTLVAGIIVGGLALMLAGVGLLVFRNATSRGGSQLKTRPVELART